MANSYDDDLKIFSLDTGPLVTWADLLTLKGRAPDSADLYDVLADMTLKITDQNWDVYEIRWNAGAAAPIVLFEVTGADNKALTFYSATPFAGAANYGHFTCDSRGSAGGRWTVQSNSASIGQSTTALARRGYHFYGGTIRHLNYMRVVSLFSAGHTIDFSDVLCKDSTACFSFENGAQSKLGVFENVSFQNCVTAWTDSVTTAPVDWLKTFYDAKFKFLDGRNAIAFRFGDAGSELDRYMKLAFSANDYFEAPTWDDAVGVQAATDVGSLNLKVEWGAASQSTGDKVRYRVYMRAGSAPDVFGGLASPYYVCETAELSTVIPGLVAGTEYFFVVRAATEFAVEDSNTECLSAMVSGGGTLFSDAVNNLLAGLKVRRAAFGLPIEYLVVVYKFVVGGVEVDCAPTIMQMSGEGVLCEWFPSQADMIADDWEVVE